MPINIEAVSNLIASIDEDNKCHKKAHMLANVAARLCRDICCSYDPLVVADGRIKMEHSIANVLRRNQTETPLRRYSQHFRA
jgi:hypothetical protein